MALMAVMSVASMAVLMTVRPVLSRMVLMTMIVNDILRTVMLMVVHGPDNCYIRSAVMA
jgi:hypothetical protein